MSLKESWRHGVCTNWAGWRKKAVLWRLGVTRVRAGHLCWWGWDCCVMLRQWRSLPEDLTNQATRKAPDERPPHNGFNKSLSRLVITTLTFMYLSHKDKIEASWQRERETPSLSSLLPKETNVQRQEKSQNQKLYVVPTETEHTMRDEPQRWQTAGTCVISDQCILRTRERMQQYEEWTPSLLETIRIDKEQFNCCLVTLAASFHSESTPKASSWIIKTLKDIGLNCIVETYDTRGCSQDTKAHIRLLSPFWWPLHLCMGPF